MIINPKYLFYTMIGCASVFLLSCSAQKEADRMAERNTVKTIYPESAFDSIAAKQALSYGTSSIKGVVFTKPKTQFGYNAPLAPRIYGKNLRITLLPVTPYFEAWYNLRKEKENKNTIVYMSKQSFRFRLEALSDEYGRFKFERLKPGRYFLQTNLAWVMPKGYNQYVGSGSDGWGTTNYYQYHTYNEQHNDRLEQFVEITQDGTVVEVKLK